MPTVDEFLSCPLVAHVAATGPTVRPVWFLWEEGAFWWLTGPWSALGRHVERDPQLALVVDTCDLTSGEVLQVTARGSAELLPLDWARAERKLTKYLGPDVDAWPSRFQRARLEAPATKLVRLLPDRPPTIRDLSYQF